MCSNEIGQQTSIRRWLEVCVGFSHDRIAASLGISKGVVTKSIRLAGAAGLDSTSACDIDEGELERRLLGKFTGPTRYAQPDYGRIHQQLRRKGMTLTLLWEEYQAAFADRQTYAIRSSASTTRRSPKLVSSPI
nr:hypothetical protein [Burkholderia anthina]